MNIDLPKHLVTRLANTDLEEAQLLNVKVEELSIRCEAHVLTDRFVSRSNQILEIENEGVLLDDFYLFEKTRIKGTLLNIEADTIDLFGYIKIEPMLLYQVNGEYKVLNIRSHDANHKDKLEGELFDPSV